MNREQRRGIRCCGRFAYWRLPIGPWQCVRVECGRLFDGPIPASAVRRFDDHVAELAAAIPDWTMEQRVFARRCFPGVWSTTFGAPA